MIDPRRNQPFGSECVMTGGAGYPINICYIHTHIHIIIYIYIERDTIIFRVFYTPDNFYVLSFWSLHIHSRRRVTRCHHGSMRPGILVHCPSPCSDQAQSLQHLTQSFLCRRAVQGGNPKKMQNGRVYQHG